MADEYTEETELEDRGLGELLFYFRISFLPFPFFLFFHFLFLLLKAESLYNPGWPAHDFESRPNLLNAGTAGT